MIRGARYPLQGSRPPFFVGKRKGQAVLEALLVFATYAVAALVLVSASKAALSKLDSEGTGRVASLSAASLACVTFGSYSLRSSTLSMDFPFSKTFPGLSLPKEIRNVQCPVGISGAERAIVSDLSGGVPTA